MMKLTYHIGALDHYMSLTKNHERTLNFFMDLKENSNLPGYQPLVHYLCYWIENNSKRFRKNFNILTNR